MNHVDPIQETIHRYVFEHYPAAKEKSLKDHDPLLELGIIDSLGVLDLVAFLESEFELTIADDALEPEDFASIEALAAFVRRQLRCPSSN